MHYEVIINFHLIALEEKKHVLELIPVQGRNRLFVAGLDPEMVLHLGCRALSHTHMHACMHAYTESKQVS